MVAEIERERPTRAYDAGAGSLARSSEQKPPVSDTGAKITVHWFRASFTDSDYSIDDAIELLNCLTDEGYVQAHDYGHFFYKKCHEFVFGIKVYYEPRVEGMYDYVLEIPGEACDVLGLESLQLIACNCAKINRFDVAFDGLEVSPREMADWVRKGDIRSRIKRDHMHLRDALGAELGNTLELGSRQSDAYVRVYDRRGYTRIEVEFKGEKAELMRDVLMSSADEFAALAVGVLRSVVDFVDSSSSSNISRAPLKAVWAAFTEGLEKVKLALKGTVEPTVSRNTDHVERNAAAIYMYYRMVGSLSKLLEMGRNNLKPKHLSLMAKQGIVVARKDKKLKTPWYSLSDDWFNVEAAPF